MTRKWFHASDGYRVLDLIQGGIDHLIAGKLLFHKDARFYDSAGYLTHVGIELLLKSVLLEATERFPEEHSLVRLSRRVKDVAQTRVPNHCDVVLAHLDQFAELRYPRPEDPVEIGDEDWPPIEAFFYDLAECQSIEWLREFNAITPTRKLGRVLMSRPRSARTATAQPDG